MQKNKNKNNKNKKKPQLMMQGNGYVYTIHEGDEYTLAQFFYVAIYIKTKHISL